MMHSYITLASSMFPTHEMANDPTMMTMIVHLYGIAPGPRYVFSDKDLIFHG